MSIGGVFADEMRPSCPHCGSDQVQYDRKVRAIICKTCGKRSAQATNEAKAWALWRK